MADPLESVQIQGSLKLRVRSMELSQNNSPGESALWLSLFIDILQLTNIAWHLLRTYEAVAFSFHSKRYIYCNEIKFLKINSLVFLYNMFPWDFICHPNEILKNYTQKKNRITYTECYFPQILSKKYFGFTICCS